MLLKPSVNTLDNKQQLLIVEQFDLKCRLKKIHRGDKIQLLLLVLHFFIHFM